MQRWVALGLVVMLSFSGCASYRGGSLQAPTIDTMSVSRSEEGVTVAADPYVQKDRQRSAFDADLSGEGVVPIRVVVRNQGERRFMLRASNVTLSLADGTQIASAGATAVASRLDQGFGEVVGWGIGFGLIGAMAASHNKDQVRSARLSDYKTKELQDVALGIGESGHGFVFFVPPKGTPAFSDAVLTIPLVDVKDASNVVVRVPLSALNFRGSPGGPK